MKKNSTSISGPEYKPSKKPTCRRLIFSTDYMAIYPGRQNSSKPLM
jgi:hypothetical protein